MRIIARLDIKSENLIKGIQFEGLRVIGNPNEYALKYYNDNADEILLIDTVASLYNRNNIVEIINKASENIFVPITAGGGIREIKDVEKKMKIFKTKINKKIETISVFSKKDLIKIKKILIKNAT